MQKYRHRLPAKKNIGIGPTKSYRSRV